MQNQCTIEIYGVEINEFFLEFCRWLYICDCVMAICELNEQ